MKRVLKSPPPNALTRYAQNFPHADWDNDFRNHAVPPDKSGDDYKKIKTLLVTDQGGLCAYCEAAIGQLDTSLQRVEHYHPKSDQSASGKNWALDWDNIMAVCVGGEKVDRQRHPLPENLSCDAHKNHYFTASKLTGPMLAQQLLSLTNPLHTAAFPCLFDLDKQTGKFAPSTKICLLLDEANQLPAGATEQKIAQTVRVLNLNCDRLCEERLEILKAYNQEVARARKMKDAEFKVKLEAKWFANRWPSFFTTRRILLGADAEVWLKNNKFSG
jgi:uncharacterized protein (TIGR02646 family)